MDYDRNDFPIERDDPPSDHITFSNGVSRAEVNGAEFVAVRRENIRKAQAARHGRQSHTS